MSYASSENDKSNSNQVNRLQPWQAEGWFDQVSDWIDEKLHENGRNRTGDIEILHQRPWSTFARVPTDQGIVYFKAPAPSSASEGRLTEALSRWRPDCTVLLLAVEPEPGWLLTADSGVTLRELTRNQDQLAYWREILPLYADLQKAMISRVPDILEMGVSDRRLAILPEKFEELLADTENLRVGLESGLTPEEYERLLQLRPTFAEQCQKLADFNIPETLTHEEVTEVNVIYDGERYSFTDWDNGVAHPFFSLLTTLRTIAHWIKPTPDQVQIDQLRDLYLESWRDFGTHAELVEASKIAFHIGMVNRSLSYHRTFAPLPEHYKIEYDGIPGWLQDYLEWFS